MIAAYIKDYASVRPALRGDDLKKMGLAPGPRYKRILDALLEARLNGTVASAAQERALAMRLARR